MNEMIRARVKPEHIAKLNGLSQATGLTHSQLLRLFVERAELHGAPAISVDLPTNDKADASSHQAKSTGIVSPN
jgi:antitoxin component of RelBE/YafQ-DinJ toxin-antitoxin module